MKENASKINKGNVKWTKKRNGEGYDKNLEIQGDSSNNGASYNKKFKKKVDSKEMQCYCFLKFDHYARDSYLNQEMLVTKKNHNLHMQEIVILMRS